MAYRFLGWLSGLLLRLFHRRVSVTGLEQVPASGPLVVCANHHGSLVDPMVLLASLPRRLRPLAKAPLFHDPLLRPFLRAAGALPVYRPQDRALVQGSNRELLRACREALAAGECILIFPEGLSKPEPTLSTLRPGAARMALEAEAAQGYALGVRLLPVGIHLDEAAWFRRGKLFVQVGSPIPAAPLASLHARDPEEAVAELTRRIEGALRSLIVEAESAEDLRLIRRAVRAWAREEGRRLDDTTEADLARRFASGYRAARERDPAAVLRLRTAVEAYGRTLEHFGLGGGEIDARYGPGRVASFLAIEGTALLLGAPLGLVGIALNWAPYRATSLVAGRFSESEDVWASAKLGAALVLFPLYWLLAAGAVGVAAGAGPGLLALASMPLTGLWALRFRDLKERFRRQVRAFFLLAGGGGLKRHLAESRRAIHDQVEDLRASLDAPGSIEAAARAPAAEGLRQGPGERV